MIVWPWTPWLRARRQIAAMREWSSPLVFRQAADGLFAVRDYTGVESVYRQALSEIEQRLATREHVRPPVAPTGGSPALVFAGTTERRQR